MVNGRRTSTWSLGRVPADGDTVVIPKNYTLIIDDNLKSSSTFYIQIYGTLNLDKGKLDIGENSIINVYNSGKIESPKGNPSERILIGDVYKYLGSNGTVFGPAFASKATGVAPNGFFEYQCRSHCIAGKVYWF